MLLLTNQINTSFDQILLGVLAFNLFLLSILTFAPKIHNKLAGWFL